MTPPSNQSTAGSGPEVSHAWLSETRELLRNDDHAVRLHSNEFYKIVLAPQGGYSRRIHVWSMDAIPAWRGNVHGHCWPFDSLVLSGALVEETYSVSSGDEVDAYVYYASEAPMRRDGRVSLTRTSVVQFGAGDRYHRNGSELHVAYPAAPRTVTALTHTLLRSDSAHVYVRDSRSGTNENSRAVSHREVAALIELLEDIDCGAPFQNKG